MEEEFIQCFCYQMPHTAKLFIEAGVDVNCSHGEAFFYACFHPDMQLIDLLMESGFDLQTYGYRGYPGLVADHLYGHQSTEVLKFLLDSGVTTLQEGEESFNVELLFGVEDDRN